LFDGENYYQTRKTQTCKLTSLSTGKEYVFASLKDACDFLGRAHGYIATRLKRDGVAEMAPEYGSDKFDICIGKKAVVEVPWTQKIDQPCWKCKNFAGGCCWSRSFEPIKGWLANKIQRDNSDDFTYEIIYCPEFYSDGS